MRECVRSTSILVTIIVPVYNVESYIDECLKSLVSQTYRNIEIICVNDGSTDDGVSIVNKYKGEDERIILVNQQNSGVSVARNIGLSLARGEMVLFVDSDDYVDLDAVELIVESFSKDKPDLILFGYRDVVFAGGGEQKKLEHLPNEYFRRSDLTRVIVTCWSKAYSLEFLRKNSIKFKEDIDKDIYSRAECVEIVQYVHDNIGGIYGGADTRTWLDMHIFITHSLLRLARSARDIFEDVFDFLCDDCKKRNRAEQKVFYDFLSYLGVEYQVESREYFKGVLPPFLYTNKSGAWLKELELIGK